MKDFYINCASSESDYYEPREFHGACESLNQHIYVFGGIKLGQSYSNTTDKINQNIEVLGDIIFLDKTNNKWKKIEANQQNRPVPRYGHSLFCYYTYLILHGGMSRDEEFLGDLWVFDLIRWSWHRILDSPTVYDLKHYETKGPANRAFATG